jgi:hypothetical protein
MLGYFFLIEPIKKRRGFIQTILSKQNKVKASDQFLVQVHHEWMDEKKELIRWSSSQGVLLSWKAIGKSNKREFFFDWMGPYEQVLHLLRNWPVQFKITQMHWKQDEKRGVQWSGHYEEMG